MSNNSTNPQLSFYLQDDWLGGYLRADQVRYDTLVQLVKGWSDDDVRDDAIAALDELARVLQSPRVEGELDAAVEAVEDVAGMDTAEVKVDRFTAVRLSRELATVTQRLTRFAGGKLRIPRQRRGA